MNRFSTLCGWLAQRQGWRVKGWIWPSDRAISAKANSWLDYQRSLEKYEMGEGEMRETLSIHPCGTSRIFFYVIKSYDMGPSRFTSHPRGRCAAYFIALKYPSPWPGFEAETFGSSGQHTNHYTTEAAYTYWLHEQVEWSGSLDASRCLAVSKGLFNWFKPRGNYMYHLFYQSMTLQIVFVGFIWLSV
jgi:hypothetical protein